MRCNLDMQDQSNFSYIWDTWIEPLIETIMAQADGDFINTANLQRRSREELHDISEKFFLQKRHELKCEYYGSNYKQNGTGGLMDFHKLSSVLCRTLIEYKVFKFDIDCGIKMAGTKKSTDIDWFVKNTLINYRLAFYASVVFLYQSMLFLYSDSDKGLFDKLTKKKKLDLYSTLNKIPENKVHASFENSVVLGLSKRDISGHSFDLLLYATMMYQLEEYNKLLLLKEDI